MGPVVGLEVIRGNWMMGMGIGWNQRTVNASEYDMQGNVHAMRIRFKYHTFEMPFHYFIGNGPIGLGFTLDVGRHKIFEISELMDAKRNVMQELQVGHKFGLRFRTSKSGFAVTGMVYYQWTYFSGDVEVNNVFVPIKPIQIGARLCISLFRGD
jgi:hypothetical protein